MEVERAIFKDWEQVIMDWTQVFKAWKQVIMDWTQVLEAQLQVMNTRIKPTW